ncbi:MAG: PEGA domain-containing protein [Acidobacteriota bacterium]
MKKCAKCSKYYPDPFAFCPVDGAELQPEPGSVPEAEAYPAEPAQIKVRTLMLSLGILMLTGLICFIAVFSYLYMKPKYGGLVVKTTPAGATILLDGKQRGTSPITLGDLRSGGHQVKAVKDGYDEFVQEVEVMPYSTENIHMALKPLVANLTNEQLAEVESWKKKLENAQQENILLPPPDDYNVLYFADRILAIDPASAYAADVKAKLAETVRQKADLAYAREDWLSAENEYKSLAVIFPNDISINERLADISAKIDAAVKGREKQIEDWKNKAEAALKAGVLLPPEKDNAWDALRSILRLDRKNVYAQGAVTHLMELLQSRGDTKLTGGDLQGARTEFKLALQYFPDDKYSASRLVAIDARLADAARSEQQRLQRLQEEQQQSRDKVINLRASALGAYRTGAQEKALTEWQEYLKLEPNSDEAYFYLGAIYLEQKQLDTAILSFEKCLSLNPNNAYAHLNLGILYDRHRNDLGQAAEHLERAKALGGVDKYAPERIQSMIHDLQERMQLNAMKATPFAVEHKHVFSSCKGTLRITDDGVEFKTTETDHSFFEAYTNLQNFTVVGEEVSIRTRNNKKYNFRLLKPADAAMVRRLAALHLKT